MEHVHENDVELGPSELGTKEYWDQTYTDGLSNFKEGGLIDEGWFGEDSCLRIVKWLVSSDIKRSSRIVDLGCGNGILLLDLAEEGFTDLYGYDYSESAVELAKTIAVEKNAVITYEAVDLLGSDLLSEAFDVATDKGTYDAISLYSDNTKEKRYEYISNVCNLLKPKGFLVITSCNWTQKELLSHFGEKFVLHHVIPTPSFKFGGTTGNLVTSLVLQKKGTSVSEMDREQK